MLGQPDDPNQSRRVAVKNQRSVGEGGQSNLQDSVNRSHLLADKDQSVIAQAVNKEEEEINREIQKKYREIEDLKKKAEARKIEWAEQYQRESRARGTAGLNSSRSHARDSQLREGGTSKIWNDNDHQPAISIDPLVSSKIVNESNQFNSISKTNTNIANTRPFQSKPVSVEGSKAQQPHAIQGNGSLGVTNFAQGSSRTLQSMPSVTSYPKSTLNQPFSLVTADQLKLLAGDSRKIVSNSSFPPTDSGRLLSNASSTYVGNKIQLNSSAEMEPSPNSVLKSSPVTTNQKPINAPTYSQLNTATNILPSNMHPKPSGSSISGIPPMPATNKGTYRPIIDSYLPLQNSTAGFKPKNVTYRVENDPSLNDRKILKAFNQNEFSNMPREMVRTVTDTPFPSNYAPRIAANPTVNQFSRGQSQPIRITDSRALSHDITRPLPSSQTLNSVVAHPERISSYMRRIVPNPEIAKSVIPSHNQAGETPQERLSVRTFEVDDQGRKLYDGATKELNISVQPKSLSVTEYSKLLKDVDGAITQLTKPAFGPQKISQSIILNNDSSLTTPRDIREIYEAGSVEIRWASNQRSSSEYPFRSSVESVTQVRKL